MKKNFKLFLFLPLAIFGFAFSLAQEFPNMDIVGADEFLHIDLAVPPDDLFDASEAGFDLSDQMQVCQADETAVVSFESPMDDFFDNSDAPFDLPDQMGICQADEDTTISFETPSADFFDTADAGFDFPDRMQVCQADETANFDFITPPDEFFDSGEGDMPDAEIISGKQVWNENKSIDHQIIIEAGAELTVKNGLILNFSGTGEIVVNGKLDVRGTVKNPIKIIGQSGYGGTMISIGDTGAAALNNVQINSILADGLPPRQTAVNVSKNGRLKIQGSEIVSNAVAVKLSQVLGANIQINRTKFFNNVVDVENIDPANDILPDFGFNWWNDAHIVGSIDSSNPAPAGKRDPVVIVPGIVGSWPENGIWAIDPIFHSFDDLIAQIKAQGYVEGVDLFYFPYNWRLSNVENAWRLRDKIGEIKTQTNWPKVDIAAHSMGGLLARQYIESENYRGDVDQLITLATPNNGSPQSYLTWEAGEISPNMIDLVYKNIFLHEAHEFLFPDLLTYVQQRVVSVSQLLPVYDYLYSADNGVLRQYPFFYPRNVFLENLNLSANAEKLKAVEYDKIVADLGDNQSTIAGFKVEATDQYPKWQHGYPAGYDNPFTRGNGLVKSGGDAVVPLISAQSGNIFSDELLIINAGHNDAPFVGQLEVLELLTGNKPQTAINKGQIPNLLLVQAFSPIDIQIIDQNGKWGGKNILNLAESDRISGAYYSGNDAAAEFITVPNPNDGDYRIAVYGAGQGNYTVKAAKIFAANNADQAGETAMEIAGAIQINEQDRLKISIAGNEIFEKTDKIPPEIEIKNPVDGAEYLLNQPAIVDYSCRDNDSGVASCTGTVQSGGNLDTTAPGKYEFSITAIDNAGNETRKNISYNVIYNFDGFLPPINSCASCAASIFKAGSTVPVKFRLKDYYGKIVKSSVLPQWPTPIKKSSFSGEINEAVCFDSATVGGEFKWDDVEKQYIYNWKTDKTAAGYFWQIGARLDDGKTRSVDAGLK